MFVSVFDTLSYNLMSNCKQKYVVNYPGVNLIKLVGINYIKIDVIQGKI